MLIKTISFTSGEQAMVRLHEFTLAWSKKEHNPTRHTVCAVEWMNDARHH